MKNLNLDNSKKIIKYIINNNNVKKSPVPVHKYISDNAEKIISELNIDIDILSFIEKYADCNNSDYYRFIKILQKYTSENKRENKVRITYREPYYYIENTNFGNMINNSKRKIFEENLNILSKIDETKKGYIYEKFCSLFLEDMGFIVNNTKLSKDEGIDIIAKTSISNNFFKYIDLSHMYILAQVKCCNTLISKPIIKQIIGDSIVLKFQDDNSIFIGNDPVILMVFSYSGFSKTAIKYAEKYKVYLMTNESILDCLCSQENSLKNFKCIKYINRINEM